MKTNESLFGIVALGCAALLLATPMAFGGIRYVNAARPDDSGDGLTWATAKKTLQAALVDGNGGDDVWVAAGVYKPDQGGGQSPGGRTASFQLLSGAGIYGGFAGGETLLSQRDIAANPTILSGDLAGDDNPVSCFFDSHCSGFGDNCLDGICNISSNNGENSFHVVTGSGASSAILDGFTITGGNANGGFSDSRGGGMITNGGSPTVANCVFTRNFAGSTGGGMYNSSNGAKITQCRFLGNSCGNGGGGGMVNDSGSSATVSQCTFRENVSQGIGGGTGGGLYTVNNSTSTVINCAFFGNSASAGGGLAVTNNSGGPIVNCALSGNTANRGGAVYLVGTSPALTNCTLSRNIATGNEGGGIYTSGGSPTVRNSILWENSDPGGMDESAQIHTASGTPVVNYSIVQGGWTGTSGPGNSASDPLFLDANGDDNVYGTLDDDLRLSAGSPASDAGNNGHLMADIADLDGDGDTTEEIPLDLLGSPRRLDDPFALDSGSGAAPVVDMGAYERQVNVVYVDAAAAGADNGSSWVHAFLHLQSALSFAAANPAITEIWVADGAYMPDGGRTPAGGAHVNGTGDRTATFQLLNGLTLYGGFAGGETSLSQRNVAVNPTILSGDLTGDDTPLPCTQNSPDCDSFGGLCWNGFCNISQNNGENSRHVVTGSGTDASAMLDGFIIVGGNANVGDLFPQQTGGGMFNQSGSPTVIDCTFNGNSAGFRGGGAFNWSGGPTLTGCSFHNNSAPFGGGLSNFLTTDASVTNCIFKGNFADGGAGIGNVSATALMTGCAFLQNLASYGGGVVNSQGQVKIVDCVFIANSATDVTSGTGGGLFNISSNAIIAGCTFYGNTSEYGGGIYNNNSDAWVTNCIFTGNSAVHFGGGVNNLSDDSTFINCVFSGNSASYGGGMLNTNSNPTMLNCTFANNSATWNGGGIGNYFQGPHSPVISNSILWNNSDEGGTDESAQIHTVSGTPVINYSTVQGGWSGAGGTGNSAADPLFINAYGMDNVPGTVDDNLRVQAGSPAIDTGNNVFVPADAGDLDGDGDVSEQTPLDLDGYPRFVDGDENGVTTVDMGAYEYSPDCNLNGIPDGLDIASGTSSDADMDGIPDECSRFTGQCVPPLHTRWSCPDNWNIAGDFYPDDVESAAGVFVTLPGGAIVDLDVNATIPGLHILSGATLEMVQSGAAGDLTVNTPSGLLIAGAVLAGNNHIIDSAGTVTIAPGGLYEPGTTPSSATLVAPSLRIEGPPSTPDGLPAATMILRDNMSVYITGEGEHRSYGEILVGEDSLIEVYSGTFFVDGDGVYAAASPGARAVLRVGTASCCGTSCVCKLAANGPPHTPTFELSGEMSIEVNGDFVNQGVVRVADDATVNILAGMYHMKAGSIHEKNATSPGLATASLVAPSILIEPGEETPYLLSGAQLELTDSMTMQCTGPLHLQGASLKDETLLPPKLNISGDASLTVGGTCTLTGIAESTNTSTVGVSLAANFDNYSFSPNLFDWTNGQMTLNGSDPQTFEVAAADTGPAETASIMPFAIGTLRIAADSDVAFVDVFNNDLSDQAPCSEALYVGTLLLEANASATFDNCRVYYDTLVIDPTASITFLGCAADAAPPGMLPNPDGLNRARFITFRIPPPTVATGGTATAIRVELVTIASPPGAPAGTQVRYVNAVGFNGSNHGAMSIDCGDAPAHCPNFACAVLGCEPEYRNWAAEIAAIDPFDSVIHVTGDAVVPSSMYSVMHESKGGTPSSPLPVQSAEWGDVVVAFGVVNVTDLSAVKDWLVELSGAPCKSRVWMRSPVNPFADANVLDLSNVANVLAGSADYSGPPISTCP